MTTTGPPSRTSTLMSEGRDGSVFGSAGGLLQLSMNPAIPAKKMKERKEMRRRNLTRP
ncbi:hypothetical protein SBA1_1150004 [Candidatus Sulfotelmatobacter kueseliae]|uniref:Uncharacterized protein n=1 Tax=Candidatus Sulfotelmatobacter kueseliae TaxID=2042962 RepID=A0A2U3K0M3_9BACT|nr:hypothetical protein SBA1_1150004 [Candidatus Sulfotelmatobacter kueseliae]